VLIGLCGTACGPAEQDGSPTREIRRVPIQQSRFKPDDLEALVDTLVDDVEAAGATQDTSIAVVLKALVGFWYPITIGANRALGELEIEGAVVGAPEGTEDDDAQTAQRELLEDLLTGRHEGLVLAPVDDSLNDVVDQWVEGGGTAVTIDGDLPNSSRQLYIGTDNHRAGITAGETLLDVLDGVTGRVIVLGTTDEPWAAGVARTQGAANTLAAAGNYVTVLNSRWESVAEIQALIEAIEDPADDAPLVGMLGVFANAHACATAALQSRIGELPKIVAFDFEDATINYMEQGVIQATHAQRQYYMGYLAVYTLYSIQVLGIEQTKSNAGIHLFGGTHLNTGLDVIYAHELTEWDAFVDEIGID